MLLTQKAQPLNLGRHHRRHPASLSNIAVVAHPTPGLLSLSKPPQRLPSRHPQRPQSPRFPQRNRIHRPTSTDLPSAQFHPEPPRGRTPQNKAQPQRRSASQVHLPDTPTPADSATVAAALPFPRAPVQQVSTPEPPTIAAQPSGRLARTRRTRHKSTPAAALDSNASPERRAPSPAKASAPIAVPNGRRAPSPAAHKVLSHSDPLSKLSIHTNLASKNTTRKDKRRRNRAKRVPEDGQLPLAEWDFPAPGSSEDDAEASNDEDEPSTPLGQTGSNDKAWQRALFQDGPKTAPLQSSTASPARAQGQFPFFQFPVRAGPARTKTPAPAAAPTTPTSTPRKQARPDHRRAPSYPASLGRASTAPEPMFHLSEDEGEALPAGADVREKMALLFGNRNGSAASSSAPLFPTNGTPSPSPRKVQRAPSHRESVDGVARQLFASSSFQLAPEPIDLPKPSFLLSIRA